MQNNWSIEKFQAAWKVASKMHDGQKYGGSQKNEKVEYLNHIGSVVFEISNALQFEENIDQDLAIICAVLHDTIEDTSLTYDDISNQFGKPVAEGVLALSKNEKLKDKQTMILDSLKRIQQQPKEIWMVKMADRIANLQQPPYYWTLEKKEAYRQEAIQIYTHLKEANEYLANRLKQKVEDYQEFLYE